MLVIAPTSPGSITTPAGYPTAAYNFPEAISFVLSDDGAGGNVYLNGQGVTNGDVAGAVDIATFFKTTLGVPFSAIPLLQAFKRLTPATAVSGSGVMSQLVRMLDISIVPLLGTTAPLPSINYLQGIGSADVNIPFLAFETPGGEGAQAGVFRVNLRLRHSITN